MSHRRRQPKPSPERQIRELWDDTEQEIIVRCHGVRIGPGETRPGTVDCPALEDGRCTVYDSRPTICRLWGTSDALPCPHGCRPPGGRISETDSRRIMRRSTEIGGTPDLSGLVARYGAPRSRGSSFFRTPG